MLEPGGSITSSLLEKDLYRSKEIVFSGFWVLYSLIAPLCGLLIVLSFHQHIAGSLSEWDDSTVALCFVSMGGLLAAAALIPSFVLAGFIGYFYHQYLPSFAVSLLATWVAVFLGLAFAQMFGKRSAEKILTSKPKWETTYHDILSRDGWSLLSIIFMIRLSPHVPFALTNLLVSRSRSRLTTMAFYSWLGLVPRCLFATAVGVNVNDWSEYAEQSDTKTISIMVSLVALSYATMRIRKAIRRNEP